MNLTHEKIRPCHSQAELTTTTLLMFLAPVLLRSWQRTMVASKEVKPVKLHRLEVHYRELMGALPHHQRTDFVREGLTRRSSGEPQSPPGANCRCLPGTKLKVQSPKALSQRDWTTSRSHRPRCREREGSRRLSAVISTLWLRVAVATSQKQKC